MCADHRLPLGLVTRHGIDICRGLQELHAMNIVFRDLKPVRMVSASCHTQPLAYVLASNFATAAQDRSYWLELHLCCKEMQRPVVGAGRMCMVKAAALTLCVVAAQCTVGGEWHSCSGRFWPCQGSHLWLQVKQEPGWHY